MSGRRILGFLIARPLIAVAIAAVVVGVLLLLQTHKESTPVTHRTQHAALSDEQQTQLGSQQYAKTLQQGRADIVSSGAAYAQVQRVAKRIEAVAGRDKPAFDWQVTLLRKTKVAAAIIAGGVAFTPRQYVRVVALLGAADSLPFSRSQESEADHIGLVYMARAGYEPEQAVAFWKRMQRASQGKEPPEFASDHPSDEHRIERIEQWLPEAERAYTPPPADRGRTD
jgi:predicted Zn-dependent protease